MPAPDFNPFRIYNKTDSDISDELNHLLDAMEQSRPKLNTDRRHNDAPIRALVITTATWNPASKSKRRDFLPIACWALLESYWIKEYRPKLFKDAPIAAIIRQDLSILYKPFVISDQMVLTPQGGVETSTNFPWYDMLNITKKKSMEISIKEVQKDAKVNKMWEIYDKEIAKVISTVSRSALAHNDLGPPNSVDSIVMKHLKGLVRVSSSLRCQYILVSSISTGT